MAKALLVATMYDADLFGASTELRSMLALPQEVMARPGVVDRIMEVVGTHEAVTPPGPSREELLHMVSSAKRDVNDLVSETTRCFWLRRTPALLARRNTSTSNRCC